MPAHIYRPNEGQVYSARGSDMFFKATSDSTSGAFSLMERTLPPGGQPPPRHIHVAASEGFYVLEGELTFWLDDAIETCGPGTFVLAPGGVSHTFANQSGSPARLLIIHAPAMDAYFAALHALWSDPASPPLREQELTLMRQHGMLPVPGSAG